MAENSSTWFNEAEVCQRSWLEWATIRILQAGSIPRHIAFILDGNRRYASKKHIDRLDGHAHGFDTLTKVLQWCDDIGIPEVTVYAFSVENFKRSEDEVDGLMQMAREKFRKLLEEKDKLTERGIRVRIWGDLSLLPIDIQQMAAEAVLLTEKNDRAYLNVCWAYTSRLEVAQAGAELLAGVKARLLQPADLSESLLDKCLYSPESPPPDLIIRTSGEVRLSDFLLWQSSHSVLAFIPVLWPEITIWHLFRAILYYQLHEKNIAAAENHYTGWRAAREKEQFFNTVKTQSLTDTAAENSQQQDQVLKDLLKARDYRIKKFLKHLAAKRRKNLELLAAGNGSRREPPKPEMD